MERIILENEVICREKVGITEHPTKIFAHQSKGHQLYILLSLDSVRALEIHDVARTCLTNNMHTRDAQ